MIPKILITGATGNVGAEVARALQAFSIPYRAAVIDMAEARRVLGEEVNAVRFSFGAEETYASTFQGVEQVFLMRPPQITDVKRRMFPAIDAAVAAGVKNFVFLSLIGIESNRIVPHYKVEQYLRGLGVDYTFLRASFFMQNLNTTHRAEIRDRDELFIPAGNSKTSFLDTRDIGAVAARVLIDPGHEGQAYDLTGPEALDYNQVAEQLTQVLGRRITYRNPSLAAFVLRKVREGTPLAFALVMAFLYRNTQTGMAAPVTDTVAKITGRPPISLRQYLEDYRNAWER